MFRKKKDNTKEVESNLQNLKKVLPSKTEKRNLMVKDLMNDLVREEEINKRIKENLRKPFDPIVIRENIDLRDFASSVMTTFTSFATSVFPR